MTAADPSSAVCADLLELALGTDAPDVERALAELERDRVLQRLWARDHSLWRPEPHGIADRLGWLDCPSAMSAVVPELRALSRDVTAAGMDRAVLIGMGGSSLAPALFSSVFRDLPGLSLEVLDSTDPAVVHACLARLEPRRTVVVVSTKSGGTIETLSLLHTLYRHYVDALGAGAGRHFVAITDPGSALASAAEGHAFRATLLARPDIGGRFSALAQYGLAPATIVGADPDRLLAAARSMARRCSADVATRDNLAARLAAAMSSLARGGRDKLTVIVSPSLAGLDAWLEQLVAESTGKDGTGILPVVGEPVAAPERYGDDRCFAYVRLAGDEAHDASVAALVDAGRPVLTIRLADRYDIGGAILLWEMAVAIAGHRLGVQPFDQPDVEAAKVRAREMVAAYRAAGALPDRPATLAQGLMRISGDVGSDAPGEALRRFVAGIAPGPGAYVALQAFLPPTPETEAALAQLRARLAAGRRVAVTVGYGPRFLHSTGQLHKGDAGRGRFVQLTCDHPVDVAIPDTLDAPDSTLTFGVLEAAQALGDARALRDAGRRVLEVHLGRDVPGALHRLAASPG